MDLRFFRFGLNMFEDFLIVIFGGDAGASDCTDETADDGTDETDCTETDDTGGCFAESFFRDLV